VRPLGTAWVLGKQAPLEIVDVLWQEDLAHVTTVQRVMQPIEAAGSDRARLVVRFRSLVFEVDEGTPFSIGRDPTSSLVVETEWVSRNHALIEWKRGYFMFADRSTNGSWIRIGEDDELFVHRDEVHLRRTGSISLGQAHQLDDTHLIWFQCGE
jgi:adenylate cyclase